MEVVATRNPGTKMYIKLGPLLIQKFVAVILLFHQNLESSSGSSSGCACIGDTLTYSCTVIGNLGGATVWTGTAFDCSSGEITLLHSSYRDDDGTFGVCNHGDIVARSLGVEGSNYTSQLNVTVTPDVIGKAISCINYDGTNEITEFSKTVPGAGPFSSVNNLYISVANFTSNEFTFNWSPVTPDCRALHYNILASNCGSCPTITTNTTVTCTDVPTNGTMCTFAVETSVCGAVVGNTSDTITIITIATDKEAAPSTVVNTLTPDSTCTVSPIPLMLDSNNNSNLSEAQIIPSGSPLLISTIVLIIVLVVSVTIFTVAILAQIKVKAKIQAELDRANGVFPKQSRKKLSKIEITENVAYGTAHRVY